MRPLAVAAILCLAGTLANTAFAQCGGVGVNNIQCENALPGDPVTAWDTGPVSDLIEGFPTDISVNKGSTVNFKIRATSSFRVDIYRIGFYGGQGGRKIATGTALPAASQPACQFDSPTRMVDCGNWSVTASWAVPTTVVSGLYVARAIILGNTSTSNIYFIVRDDSSTSDILFQTSDTTWQAYNYWGGYSYYSGSPDRAYRVSYNRPFAYNRQSSGQSFFFSAEYPLVRFLESNGYAVTYTSGVDSDRRGSLIRNHKVFISAGHDEYWSGPQRVNVEAARAAGVHLAFLSGNEVYWKTRWENSLTGEPYRTMTCYKETLANAKIDPSSTWTGTFKDPRFSADGNNPENKLTGQLFAAVYSGDLTVPANEGKLRFWRNTSMANLAAGTSATIPGIIGYEFDRTDVDNGVIPPGWMKLSLTAVASSPLEFNYGAATLAGSSTHSFTLYRHSSRALVFGAGSVQYSWGLNDTHDNAGPAVSIPLRQATVNLLADMGVQPATINAGLSLATASTDFTAPSSQIASPAAGSTLPINTAVTISGTASDTGGQVGGVEVSFDGGTSWHPATGRASWSYTWTPTASGFFTLRSRAVDDSGNIETPSAGRTVTVGNTSGFPATPSSLTASPGNTQVTLSWGSAAGASSYRLKRGLSNGGPYTTVVSGLTATAYADTGLTNGVTYYYVVTAVNSAGESAISNQASAVPGSVSGPPAPAGLTASGGNGQVSLGWTASSGASSYAVKRSTTNGGPYTVIASSVTATSYLDSGLTNGTTYYYVVSAFNSVEGPNSSQASGTPQAPAGCSTCTSLWPTNPVPVAFQSKSDFIAVEVGVRFRSDVAGTIRGIRYYRGPQNAGASTGKLWSASGTQLAVASFAAPTTTGWQQVLFSNGVAISANTVYTASVFLPTGGYAQDPGYFVNTWNSGVLHAPADTAGTPNGVYFFNGSSSGFPNTGWQQANYWVDVLFDQGAQVQAPPSGLSATGGNGQVALSWTGAAGASTYNVKRSTANGGPYSTINTTANTAFNDTSVSNGTTYYYVITASGSPGESANSNQASATPQVAAPSAPQGLTATRGNGVVSLAWTNAAGAATYNVKRSTANGGPYGLVTNTAGTSFNDTGLTNGVTYYYVVTAQNGGGESGNSNQASATPQVSAPAAPQGLIASGGNGVVSLSWSSSAGASSYNVKRSTSNGGPYGLVTNTASTTLNDTGLANGVTYYYVVTAQNSGGESGNSNQAFATPQAAVLPAPTGLTASGGNGQISLSWNAVSGASSYTIWRSNTNGGPYGLLTGTSGVTFPDNLVTNGLTYYYVITAQGSSGPSAYSNQASATPQAPASGCSTCVSLWPSNPRPGAFESKAEFIPVEVGVRFRSDVAGVIRGVRYYRGSLNNGTHIGHLWDSGGNLLASATFVNETTSSWQQVLFSAGVSVSANAIYTASVWLPNGGYSQDPSYFARSADNGVLHAPADSPGAPNGVYFYNGANSGFPNSTWMQSNYWVDVLFDPSQQSPPSAPASLSATPGNGVISLSWPAVSGASSYNVKRSTVNGSGYATIASTAGATYPDTGVSTGTTYYYVVTAIASGVESGNSPQASATPSGGGSAPAPPSGLTVTRGNGQLALGWTGAAGASSYNVKRSTTNGGPYTTVASGLTATAYLDAAVTNGVAYYYVVTASNSLGEGSPSVQAANAPFAPFKEDFEGSPSFLSDYAYVAPSNNKVLYSPGLYSIATNPQTVHDLFCSYGDHTSGSGKMMVVNGQSAVQTAWSKTISGLASGQSYTISLWVASAYPLNAAQLQVTAGGATLYPSIIAPTYAGVCPASTSNVWQQLQVTFVAQGSSATISVIDLTTAADGNDFAVDDIEVR